LINGPSLDVVQEYFEELPENLEDLTEAKRKMLQKKAILICKKLGIIDASVSIAAKPIRSKPTTQSVSATATTEQKQTSPANDSQSGDLIDFGTEFSVVVLHISSPTHECKSSAGWV